MSDATDDPRPAPPREPDPEDCCGTGCLPCVFDVYDDQLKRYREALAAWRARHASEQIDSARSTRKEKNFRIRALELRKLGACAARGVGEPENIPY